MALIYEVNLSVDKEIEQEYETWLTAHIEEMVAIEGFEGARLYRRRAEDEGQEEGDKVLWTVLYSVRDRPALQSYFDLHAPRMRQQGLSLFSGRFTASRRILLSPRVFSSPSV